jgi:predicted ribosome quality control (RQC) complex YloA/Tae2 family protein
VAAPESIEDAAYVAAYLSGWRGPGMAIVHWTEAKNVRKPKGLPPGKVRIHREREFRVTPREDGLSSVSVPDLES